jgi:TatD DNase family protein
MIPFVDIHTHFRNNDADVISVLNITQQGQFMENTEGGYFSAGLHPWFLSKENFETDFNKLTQLIDNQSVIFLGECGLDRLKGEELAFQTHVFEAQIRLAESKSKPVVIHCVKAFNEIMAIKKRLKPCIPLIIHGFNQNKTILNDLIKNDFYISCGTLILKKESIAAQALSIIPSNRLFFETDDMDMSIKTVYEKAAEALNVDLANLKKIVFDNFNRILTADNPS